jgi:hypothetical protein
MIDPKDEVKLGASSRHRRRGGRQAPGGSSLNIADGVDDNRSMRVREERHVTDENAEFSYVEVGEPEYANFHNPAQNLTGESESKQRDNRQRRPRNKQKRQQHRQKQKRSTRAAQRSDVLANEMANNLQQMQGEVDSRIEHLRDNMERIQQEIAEGKRSVKSVNFLDGRVELNLDDEKLLLYPHINSFRYHAGKLPRNVFLDPSHDEAFVTTEVILSFNFSNSKMPIFQNEAKFMMAGDVTVWDGVTPYFCVSQDGLFVFLTEEQHEEPNDIVNTLYYVRLAVEEALSSYPRHKMINLQQLHNAARSVYRKHWGDHPQINYLVYNAIKQEEMNGAIVDKAIDNANTIIGVTNAHARHLCVVNGENYDDISRRYNSPIPLGKWKKRVMMGANLLAIVGYLPWLITLIPTLYVMLGQAWYRWWFVPRYTHEQLDRLIIDRYNTRNPFFRPASKAYLRRQIIEQSRIPPPVTTEGKIEVDYLPQETSEDYESLDVSFIGSTIPGPVVAPSTHVQNLHGACNIRMLSYIGESELNADYYRYCTQLIDEMPDFEYKEMDDEEIYSLFTSKYGTRRAQRLMDMRNDDLTRRDERCNLFVKDELYLGKLPNTFKPRMIWSPSDLIIAKFSPFFHQLSKHLSRVYNVDNNVLYASGITPSDLGTWVEEKCAQFPIITESDVSNWDGSIGPTMLSLEEYFLNTKVHGGPDLGELSRRWRNMDGIHFGSDGPDLRLNLSYGRRSGDLWTSAFNTLINFLTTMYVYQLGWNSAFALVALGDDNILMRARDNTVNPGETYRRLGMKCEIIPRESVEDVGFCSGYFLPVNGSFKWTNCPFKILAKFGVDYGRWRAEDYPRYVYSIAKGLGPTAGHCPIIGSFFRVLVESAEQQDIQEIVNVDPSKQYKIHGGMTEYPDETTYEAFCRRYGFSKELVVEIERMIENTVTIDDCPIIFDDMLFIEGLLQDLGQPEYAISQVLEINYADDNMPQFSDDPVFLAPMQEEMWKIGDGTVMGAINRAVQLGQEENAMCEQLGDVQFVNHISLHLFFTFFSLISIKLGVKLHVLYNMFALNTGNRPATRNRRGRRKRRNKRQNQPRVQQQRTSAVGNFLRLGGNALGNFLAPGVGGGLGAAAGGAISQILGFGDYSVMSNTLQHAPMFGRGSRSLRVKNREYVGDITGSTTFNLTSYMINPGNKILFPWLSGLAQSYQQYRIKGMIFYYNSTSANALNSTNTALGTVLMATNYDLNEQNYNTKAEMQASYFCNSFKPSEDGIHALECDPSQRPIDVMYVDQTGEGNIQTAMYDHGNFQIATDGMQASAVIGQLWVSYDIELLKPRFYEGSVTNYWYEASTWDATNVLGTAASADSSGPNVVVTTVGGTIDLNPYRGSKITLLISWEGTSLASSGLTRTLGDGLTDVAVLSAATVATYETIGSNRITLFTCVDVSEDRTKNVTMTVDHNISAGSTTIVNLLINHVNNTS